MSRPGDRSTPADTSEAVFPGKLGIVQRVIPPYRAPFFDALAERCEGGVEVLAGEPARGEAMQHSPEMLHRATVVPAGNFYLARANRYIVCYQRKGARWLNDSRPDLLLVGADARIVSSRRLARMAREYGTPVVGWGLGALEWSAPGVVAQLRSRALRQFYRQFDGFFAYSTKAAADYIRAGVRENRVVVVGNAVSGGTADEIVNEIAVDPNAIARWKSELGLRDLAVVLSVGRLIPSKRVEDLVRACARLRDTCELVIVGEGPHRGALECLAKDVFPETRFLGDRRGRELGKCFGVSDLFVLPGPGGLAVQEALLYGLPVIVGSGDGTQVDLVREGRNGYIVRDGDVDALGSAIERVVSDRSLLDGLRAESKRTAEETNLDVVLSSFVGGLRSALGWGDERRRVS